MPRISFDQASIRALEQFIALETQGEKRGILCLEKTKTGEHLLLKEKGRLYSSLGGFLRHIQVISRGGYTLFFIAEFLSKRKASDEREEQVVSKAIQLLQKKIVRHNEKNRFFSIQGLYVTFHEGKVKIHRRIDEPVIEKTVLDLSENQESIDAFIRLVLLCRTDIEWESVKKVFQRHEEKITLYKEHIVLTCKEKYTEKRELSRLYDLVSLEKERRSICDIDQVFFQSTPLEEVSSQIQSGKIDKEKLLDQSKVLFIYKDFIELVTKEERSLEEQFFYHLMYREYDAMKGLLENVNEAVLREKFFMLNNIPVVQRFLQRVKQEISNDPDLKFIWKAISTEKKESFLSEIDFDLKRGVTDTRSLHEIVIEAKEKERKISWESLQNASKIWIGSLRFEDVIRKGKDIDAAFVVRNKIERILRRKAKTAGVQEDFYDQHIQKIFQAVNGEPLLEVVVDEINLYDIVEEVKKTRDIVSSPLFHQNYQELANQCEQIAAFLHTAPHDTATRNRAILELIRKVLKHPVYQSIKEIPMHPIASYIHTLCAANYTEAFVLDAFREIGEGLVEKTTIQEEMNFSDFLQEIREEGSRGGLIKNEQSIAYVYSFFRNAMGALSSQSIFKNFVTYDARTSIENIPGAFYDESLRTTFGDIYFRAIYTGTPTLNDEVAPEFCAVLQAIENRYFMSKEERDQSMLRFGLWHYTNLQDITSSKENGRSKAIMQLSKLYPYSFYGITITNDTPFFRDGIHGKNEEEMLAYIRNYDKGPLTNEYKELFLQELLQDENFSLEKRISEPGGGYYFPAATEKDTENWKKVLQSIVEECFCSVQENMLQPQKHGEGAYHWMQKAAFRELVHLAIIRYSQVEKAKSVREVFFDEENIGMLIGAVCKECIDRGGKLMMELFWMFSQEINREVILDAISSLYARSLLSRYRLILFDRLLPLFSLLQILNKQGIQDLLLHKLPSSDKVQSNGIVSLRK